MIYLTFALIFCAAALLFFPYQDVEIGQVMLFSTLLLLMGMCGLAAEIEKSRGRG